MSAKNEQIPDQRPSISANIVTKSFVGIADGASAGHPSIYRSFASRLDVGLTTLFALALLGAFLSACYAIVEARDFDADGPYYLLQALQHGGFFWREPARLSVQFLQQSFCDLAYHIGSPDLLTYGRLLTLGIQGWPLILTGLCWFVLPRNEKTWILGPLLNIAVIIPMASFMGITEGIIASCLMWLLYFLVEFRSRAWFGIGVTLALAVACFFTHEAAFPFMLWIAVVVLHRSRNERGRGRVIDLSIGVIALVASIHLAYYVIHPRDSFERGAFFFGTLIEFLVTPQGPGFNLPAIAAICVGVCFGLAHWPRNVDENQRRARTNAACIVSVCIFAIIGMLFLAVPEWIIIPHAYFAARAYPVLMTTVMAPLTHYLRRADWTPERLVPRPVRLLLLAIIPLQLVMQTVMTDQWSIYRRDLTKLVKTHSGIIEWDHAADALNPNLTPFRRHLVWAWSLQPLSIVLAPQNHIRAIVDAHPGIRWKPSDLDDPATLPLCAKGLDWRPYLQAIGVAPMAFAHCNSMR